MPDEIYLGDGLYASFDGFQIKLRAPRPGTDFARTGEIEDHEVYLEPDVMQVLVNFVAEVGMRIRFPNP